MSELCTIATVCLAESPFYYTDSVSDDIAWLKIAYYPDELIDFDS
jgi:hypothetical protein